MIKIGSNYMWIWVAIESESKEILRISVSKERNMLIAEHSISSLTKGYGGGKHSISTDDGIWYPQACQFLKLNHHIHSPHEKKYHRKNNAVY
jgi:putative transposase